ATSRPASAKRQQDQCSRTSTIGGAEGTRTPGSVGHPRENVSYQSAVAVCDGCGGPDQASCGGVQRSCPPICRRSCWVAVGSSSIRPTTGEAAMNFAFYGRDSSPDRHEAEITQTQQRAQAQDLVGPAGGRITRGFFDIGIPRFTGWRYRPQAARLLATLPDPN